MAHSLVLPGSASLLPAAILGLLGVRGSLTRPELASELNVSAASITAATKVLKSNGFIAEGELLEGGGGRPAVRLQLTGSLGKVIGVKVAPSHIVMVSACVDGTVQYTRTERFSFQVANAVDMLTRRIQEFIKDETHILGIGVGMPGCVDSEDSGTVDSPSLGLHGVEIGRTLRSKLDLPVLVENDVNALAAAEQVYGIGRTSSKYLVVTLGRGIGCGIVMDGEVYRGAKGGAGELGHMPMGMASVHPCPEGHADCLDALIGTRGLIDRAERAGIEVPGIQSDISDPEMETVHVLATMARTHPQLADAVFGFAGNMLGSAVAGAVNLLDPQTVVFLGEGITDWDLWRPTFEQTLRTKLALSRRSILYTIGSWDESRWALGAGALVVSSLFRRGTSKGNQSGLVRSRLHLPSSLSYTVSGVEGR